MKGVKNASSHLLYSHGKISINQKSVKESTNISQSKLQNPETRSMSGITQLFIGGMSNSTDLAALQEHLKALTSPHSGLYISIVQRLKRKTFSGYGIVKNISQDDADLLLRLANFKFGGCWYGLKPFLKRKSEINSLRNQRTAKKIYVRGIIDTITETELEHYFSQFGNVLHIQIGKHQDSGYSKGFGFVEFESMGAAMAVLSKGRHYLQGCELLCEKSKVHKTASKFATDSSLSAIPTANCTPQPRVTPGPSLFYLGPNSLSKVRRSPTDWSAMSGALAKNHAEGNLAFRVATGDLRRPMRVLP